MRLTVMAIPTEESLRLLYLDWCSAQVARRFLELSVDEVWQRFDFAASREKSGSGVSRISPPEGSAAIDRIPDYLDLVRKTAILLAEELDLPSFPVWREAYLLDSSPLKREVLGG